MKNVTDITIILDRSGSMQDIRKVTIAGFNAFLADQKAQPSPARLSLVRFDHEYDFVYAGRPIQDAEALDETSYEPRGQTALYDAMGRTIVQTGVRLAHMPEDERPSRVLVVVLTDGLENASREFTRASVAALVKEQRETYSWEFVFIGANQDAFAEGKKVGVPLTANFVADAVGTHSAFEGMSRGVSNYRSGKEYGS